MDFLTDLDSFLNGLFTMKTGIHACGTFHHHFPESQKFLFWFELSHGVVVYLDFLNRRLRSCL